VGDVSSTPVYAPPNWHGEEMARLKNAVKKGKLLTLIGRKLKSRFEKNHITIWILEPKKRDKTGIKQGVSTQEREFL